ncbi:hypothetical protein LguiB_035665 [Lonicera macranthoides]
MRSGGYTVHHSLTAEAATVVKQALSLAKRRGHAQVTPLHVASAMLSSSTCLLRKACLQSHSHPLQCKALELCFNVALNRLPTSASSPLLGPQSHHPSMSNSLVAAFKRAQAHQRRGTVENQNQPILALKVEIEQLIISILDDPSVSRVMREAGFSSTQVKTIVEQAVSLEICSQSPQSQENIKPQVFGTNGPQFPPISHFRVSLGKSNERLKSEDVTSVLDTMMNKKKKNTVVVGECLASAEGVIRGVIDKFERGDNNIHGELRFVQFISLPLFSLRNLSRQVVEEKLEELRCLVKSYVSRGVVLYLGDLKWVAEFWSNGDQRSGYYCPVEHMIMELNRLLSGIGENGKLWLMGIATFKTYMRCKLGQPSLESLWELYPLTIPVGSLELSLNLESDLQDQFKSKESRDGSSWLNKTRVEKRLTCCEDCSANFTREARSIAIIDHNNESTTTSTSSSLPSWLQQYKEESKRHNINDQECDKAGSLCKKWNSFCSSVHKHPHFASPLSSSNSKSSQDQSSPKLHHSLLNWPVIFEPNKSPKERQFFLCENGDEGFQPNLRSTKPDLLSNPNSSPNSASSSEASEDMKCLNLFKELNSKNFKILCNALEKKVPWQRIIIPEIASTILRCRSGMVKRKKEFEHKGDKEETWLFFLGVDCEGKEKIAKEIAKSVFGSQSDFIAIGLSSFSSTRADSTDQEFSNKRARNEHGQSYIERFAEAVQDNPSRVFFMEDVEQVDYHSRVGIMNAIESGRISLPGGEFVLLKDAIVIFSCESFSSMSRACSPPVNKKEEENNVEKTEERRASPSLDLNMATGDDNEGGISASDIGILDSVDRQVIFKIQIL